MGIKLKLIIIFSLRKHKDFIENLRFKHLDYLLLSLDSFDIVVDFPEALS